MYKFLLAVSCLLLITGCDPGPNDSITKNLAMKYLSGSIGGNVPVKEDMIKVLKSYEKEGAPVMTFQVGGMICDMPVLKTDKGWIGRGISCNGRIYTPEQEKQARRQQAEEKRQQSKANYLASYRQQSDDLRENGPKSNSDEDVQVRKISVSGDRVTIDAAILTLETAADLPEENRAKINEMIEVQSLEVCKTISKEINLGIFIINNLLANDDSLIVSYPIDRDSCDELMIKRLVSGVDN